MAVVSINEIIDFVITAYVDKIMPHPVYGWMA